MGWLRATFPDLNENSTEIERIRCARSYILQIIGGYLMADTSRSCVHLRVTKPRRAKIGGCLSLLQSWARFRFPFLRPRVNHPYTFPLVTRWNHQASYRGIPSELEDIRLLLDQRSEAEQNRNEYIPTREEIIVPELACIPEYMPWFRIHGKPYLLTPEERQQQIRVGRERRGPLHPKGQDYEGSPSTRPRHSPGSSSAAMQSPSPMRAPTQSPDAPIQQMIPTQAPFPMMPGMFPSPYMYPNPYMYPFPNPMAGGSSSQVRQADAKPEEQQSPPEEEQLPPKARGRRNPARNHRRPPCGTESPGHRH
ncbi:hypothetical protein Gotur_024989 [Gossypium turneri]